MAINFQRIEQKWQKAWEEKKTFQVNENSKKMKFYLLEQFPYPSGSGLHVGHSFIYTIGDIYSRFKRMEGFNLMHPMGYDSFGLPAENASIKAGMDPKKYTEKSIKYFSKQQKALGLSYDWSRMISTHEPSFYKWDQWIFLKMFEKNLTYQKKSAVNYCKECETVLANEQVHNGNCWIHSKTKVQIKHLNQWYLKITNYSKELANFELIKEWPDLIKKLQKNWIGKSHGTEINFEIDKHNWPIFTTRPDTIYGVTFLVISAQHPKLMEIVKDENKKEIEKFIRKQSSVSQEDIDQLEKEGVFTGNYALHPITKEKIPIYAGNFILADYGSGMVMAVPAHDQRDFEFAKKYNIPIKVVINPEDFDLNPKKMSRAYTGDGTLINSENFDNQKNREAIEEITKHLKKIKAGKNVTQYKLRDWLVSRQRYWGTPIPIVHCKVCGAIPVPEKDLPIELPDKVKFGKGNPLESAKDWINTKCPKCNEPAKRETDTMDTFVNSSWYYLRFLDNKNNKKIFDSDKANYWCPIDLYIGGKEHACMHDIYFRFYTKFLKDLNLINFDEPAKKLFVQGFVRGEDGNKMSKSIGNVIDPMDMIKKYGADSLRLFLVSVANPESDFNWNTKGLQSINKFVNKTFETIKSLKIKNSSKRLQSKLHRAIKQISEDISNFKYNIAVIKLRNIVDIFTEEQTASKQDIENLIKLISPFCPHIAEELWENLGNKPFLSLQSWPIYSEKLIDENIEKQEQALHNTLSDINNILNIMKDKNTEAKTIHLYTMPNELTIFNEKQLTTKLGIQTKVFAVNDKNKHDPENKSKKAKPGKPGIYIE